MTPNDMLQTLLQRLVKGEIDKATYEQLKTEILTVTQSPAASPGSQASSASPEYDPGFTLAQLGATPPGGSVSKQVASLLASGDTVGQFVVRSLIGSGGFGAVYEMLDTAQDEVRAVKVVVAGTGASDAARQAMLNEQKRRKEIKNTGHIVMTEGVHQVEFRGHRLLLLPMERAWGSLRQWLNEHPVDEDPDARHNEGLALWRQACEGVEALHEARILHLDLKPENILLVRDEEAERVSRRMRRKNMPPRWCAKVADFGTSLSLTELLASRSILAGPVPGTPLYASPEQIDGARLKDLDERSDIYSLGVILYEILDGAPPFQGSTAEAVREGHRRKQASLREIPEEYREAVSRALAKRPDDRFSGAAELRETTEVNPAEEKAFEKAQGKDCESGWKAFLGEFSEGRHAADASRRLGELVTIRETREAEEQRRKEEERQRTEAQRRREEEARRKREAEEKRQAEEEARRKREAEEAERQREESEARRNREKPGIVHLGMLSFPELSMVRYSTVESYPQIEFVRIAPGEFVMGEGSVAHRVRLTKGFELGKYPVTQAEWEAVMGTNPSGFKGSRRPVVEVSWDDAQEFLIKLNGRNDGYRYRLPTAAEWEYAARAGTTNNEEPSLSAVAWYRQNSGGETHPVGEKRPNDWGLYDMLGNVWEWCEDWYGEYPSGSVTDPKGPSTGSRRIVRGGSWYNNAYYCRVASRDGLAPGDRGIDSGFRCLREVIP